MAVVVTFVLLLALGLGAALVLTGRVDLPGTSGPGSGDGTTPPAFGPPSELCQVDDERIKESSGLASRGSQLFTVNDSESRLRVFVLDTRCSVTAVRTYADIDPVDVEDLAISAPGNLWVADIGDNRASRSSIALYRLADQGRGPATVYRMAYADGPRDAETLLLAPDGTPYIVTKSALGSSEVYAPQGSLDPGGVTTLVRVARLSFGLTGGGGGPVGSLSSLLATGGSVAADGSRMVVRTYTTAYVWELQDGDVLTALTDRDPVLVDLADTVQGEAIAFDSAGTRWYTSSEGIPFPVHVQDAQPAS